MKERRHLGRLVLSGLFFIVLMLPTIVQFSHSFEEHCHSQCNETKVHLHTDELQCQICDFQLSSFKYDASNLSDVIIVNIPSEVEKHFASSILRTFEKSNNPLRAPPYGLI